LTDDLLKAARAHASKEAEKTKVAEQLTQAQISFELKKAEYEARMERQSSIVKGSGQGSMHMKGHPPNNDAQANEIYNNWMSGRFSQLPQGEYSCGSFSFTRDSTLTPAQATASKLMDDYIDKVDDLKNKHTEKANGIESKIKLLDAELPLLEAAKENAKKKLDDAQSKDEELAWASFATSNPVEYSQIKLLFNVNTFITKVASWGCSPPRHLVKIKSLMHDLKGGDNEMDDYHPHVLLPIVNELVIELNDSRMSSIALIKDMGEFELKKVLKPMIRDFDGMAGMLQDFDSSANGTAAIDLD